MQMSLPGALLRQRLKNLVKTMLSAGHRDRRMEERSLTVHQHHLVAFFQAKDAQGMRSLLLRKLTQG